MLPLNSDKEWEKFGRNDPYYGIATKKKFRKQNLNDDSRREFFKSGEDHIAFVFETIRTSIDLEFSPSNALDFGCGVGRCAIPLARVCWSVVGVDISESMLQEARKNCSQQSISNLELVKSDDTLSRVSGPFDFVHSFAVFLHISQKRGEKIFMRLIELLSDNGIGVVEFFYDCDDPAVIRMMGSLRKRIPLWHNVVNLLYGNRFSDPLMEKNIYDLNRVLEILQKNGCGNVHLRFPWTGKFRSVLLFFQKKQDKVPYEANNEY